MFRKLAAIAVVFGAFALGACQPLPTLNLQNQVNLNTLQGIVSAYGIVVAQENLLKQQPLCKTGTKPSLTNICAPRSLIVRLQNATRVAKVSIDQAVMFVDKNPTVPPTQYIAAAQTALLAVQTIYNSAAQQANGG